MLKINLIIEVDTELFYGNVSNVHAEVLDIYFHIRSKRMRRLTPSQSNVDSAAIGDIPRKRGDTLESVSPDAQSGDLLSTIQSGDEGDCEAAHSGWC